MGPILLALLLASPQKKPNPKFAGQKPAVKQEGHNEDANRFILFVRSVKSLSVHMTLHRSDRPKDGQADLILARPGKLYYHVAWGPEDYTFAVLNGQATEVDRGAKLYDEYPSPGWQPPEANGSGWIDSCFPSPFVNESILVPPGSVDPQGHLTTFGFRNGDPPVDTILKFSDYKTNITIPDSKFVLSVPPGFSEYSVARIIPPHGIGDTLPPETLVDASGRPSSLSNVLGRKPAFIAILDPASQPSLKSLATVKKVKDIKVLVVNLSPSGKGISAGSLPVFHDPKGNLVEAWRVGATPMFYLVDGSGKITNVWYGFNKDKADKFALEISDAVSDLSSSE